MSTLTLNENILPFEPKRGDCEENENFDQNKRIKIKHFLDNKPMIKQEVIFDECIVNRNTTNECEEITELDQTCNCLEHEPIIKQEFLSNNSSTLGENALNDVNTTVRKQRKYMCGECGKVYTDKGHLHRHIDTTHLTWISCQHCTKTYADTYSLQMHINTDHKRKYTCQQCTEEYTDIYSLRRHTNTVHNQRKYTNEQQKFIFRDCIVNNNSINECEEKTDFDYLDNLPIVVKQEVISNECAADEERLEFNDTSDKPIKEELYSNTFGDNASLNIKTECEERQDFDKTFNFSKHNPIIKPELIFNNSTLGENALMDIDTTVRKRHKHTCDECGKVYTGKYCLINHKDKHNAKLKRKPTPQVNQVSSGK